MNILETGHPSRRFTAVVEHDYQWIAVVDDVGAWNAFNRR